MQRVAFQLRIKPGLESAYDEAHRHVWPELIAEMQSFGIQDYSIFRRDCELFLYMVVPNFQVLLAQLAASDINRRWQQAMSSVLEPVPSLREGEIFAMMEEVFHMQGNTTTDYALRPTQERGEHAR